MKYRGFLVLSTMLACLLASCEEPKTPVGSEPVGNAVKETGRTTLSCITFDSLSHCTLGSGILALLPSRLKVSAFGAGGGDGVSISLNDVKRWQGTFTPYHSGSGNKIIWSALSAGVNVSRFNMIQVGSSDTFKFSGYFTGAPSGSQYGVAVYQDSIYQGGQDSVDGDDGSGPSYGTMYVNQDGKLIFQWTASIATPGACQWIYEMPAITRVKLPNGTMVFGNRLVLTEQLAQGKYPYNQFDGIKATGVLDSLILKSESVLYP